MKYEEYRARVEEYRSSGKSQQEWCGEQGVSLDTLRTWIKRVRRAEGGAPELKSYDEYRSLVLECKNSGKTAKEWCAERGILYATYGTWRKKVHRREGRAVIDGLCGIEHGRKGEAKITENPPLCELRRCPQC